ncbi:MAG: ExbD/TolR family protein [Planctomycetota bacterium]
MIARGNTWTTRIRGSRTSPGNGAGAWAPLIDVLFLLLIFLLVTSQEDDRRVVEVELPSAVNADRPPQLPRGHERTVTLYADGSIAWAGETTDLDELCRYLATLPEEAQLLPLFIQADARADLGRGLGILDRLRGIGFRSCVFQVEGSLPGPGAGG